ncbi:MAG: hypothetical protein FWD17_16250 [Polyangiaceae bacterium]|nr:hypothetical protein [Polyangiaceae bacterium]
MQSNSAFTTSPLSITSSLLTGLSTIDVSRTGYSICALTQSGSVACWGDDSDGELGPNGNTAVPSATPLAVPGVSNAIGVSVGSYFACAVLQSGAVECWGDDDRNQLGSALTTGSCRTDGVPCSAIPGAVTGVTGATAVAAGVTSACALLQNGTVECWGSDFNGEIGNAGVTTTTCQGGGTCAASPATVTNVTNAVQIAVGAGFACALLQSGDVKCWGDNGVGALGNGSGISGPTATSVAW